MKNQKQEMTVREMLHYLNVSEKDKDIYVDGIDGIAVCGGEIALTPAGMKEFGAVLDMKMDGCYIMGTDKDYDDLCYYGEGKLQLAWNFIASLAGYCSCDHYKEWFEGDDAELI